MAGNKGTRGSNDRRTYSNLDRNILGKQLMNETFDTVLKDFPNIRDAELTKVQDMLLGKLVGRKIIHHYENGGLLTEEIESTQGKQEV